MNSLSPETLKSYTDRTPYSSNTQDPMLIQDGYCSPERPSYKGSARHTPKSILKEYTNTSGSKSKKGIVINETLNETRKLSMKSENSEISAMRSKKRPLSAADTSLASFEAQVRGSSKKYGHHQNANKSGFGNLWTSEGYHTGTRSEAQHVSDFQKAYVQKLQRDREQELYVELVRRSNANLNQGKKIQNQDEENTSHQYENNRQLLKSIEKKKQKYYDQKNAKQPEEDPTSLTRVEEKIELLEKYLDIYANRLRDSIIRQKDQLVAGSYIKTGNIPETLPIRKWEEKADSVEQGTMSENRRDTDKYSKSKSFGTTNQINGYLSDRWEGLNNELDQIREENKYWESKVPRNPTAETFTSTRKDGDYEKKSAEIFDKELELLQTVEEIRTKLYNSVSQRSFDRSQQSRTSPRLKTGLSTVGLKKTGTLSNKSLKKNPSEDQSKSQKMRKAYGATTLERENACLLNEGLSSTYSGFHWNADNSLKINRNK